MTKIETTQHINWPVFPLAAIASFALLYIAAAFVVLYNGNFVEGIQHERVTNDFVRRAIRYSHFHDAVFFRNAAEKLQFSKHDPDVVIKSFQLAMIKSPADFGNFLSGAVYAASRTCCREQAPLLFQEGVKRKPNDPRIHLIAGTSLLEIGQKEEAFSYLKQAMEMSPSLGYDIYRIVERHGGNLEDLIRITPQQSESLILLSSFLASKRNSGSEELQRLLYELVQMPLKPKQRISVARSALRAGNVPLARAQASRALEGRETRIDALKLLTDINRSEGNWEEFERIAAMIEKAYRETGQKEQAAAYTLEAAEKLSSVGKTEKAIEMLKKITTYNPEYAPVYLQLAQLHEKNAPETALLYLQKAIDLKPTDFDYSRQLAELYLKLMRFRESEEIYLRFLQTEKYKESAYLGLASCKESAGKPGEAILILEEGIRKVGKTKALLYELGRQYQEVGDYGKAAEVYLDYAALTPEKPGGYLLAGEMYEKAGEYSSARKQYEQALAVDPQNKQARQALSLLQTIGVSE